MKHRRTLASTPQRTAKATWTRIVALISREGSTDREQLEAARSVMEALIADECPAADPIVISGCGPRVVIYLTYNADALEMGDAVDELAWNPTQGDWSVSAPANEADVSWMNAALKSGAPRVSVRRMGEAVAGDDDKSAASALAIDWSVLG